MLTGPSQRAFAYNQPHGCDIGRLNFNREWTIATEPGTATPRGPATASPKTHARPNAMSGTPGDRRNGVSEISAGGLAGAALIQAPGRFEQCINCVLG